MPQKQSTSDHSPTPTQQKRSQGTMSAGRPMTGTRTPVRNTIPKLPKSNGKPAQTTRGEISPDRKDEIWNDNLKSIQEISTEFMKNAFIQDAGSQKSKEK